MKARVFGRFIRDSKRKIAKKMIDNVRGRKLFLDMMPVTIRYVSLDCGDHIITVDPHELIGRRCFVNGQYDRVESDAVIARLVDLGLFTLQTSTVVEIGANIGTQSVYFGLNPKVNKVVAIEPDPQNLSLLRRNVFDNGLEQKVIIVPFGVAPQEDELVLHRATANSGAASFKTHFASGDSVKVAVRPLQSILDDIKVGEESVGLIWMDVEGFEPDIFPTLLPFLNAGVPVFLEFSPQFYGAGVVEKFITEIKDVNSEVEIYQSGNWRSLTTINLILERRQLNILIRKSV
jgi:FkbM family methyltransferase